MEVEAYCVGMLVLITAVVIVPKQCVSLCNNFCGTYTGCHLGGRTVPFKANSF